MNFGAYIAAFRLGAHQIWRDKPEIVSSLFIFAILMVIFNTIYHIMPLDELGVPGLAPGHMLWYFAMTECVLVSSGGIRQFGMVISDGRLTERMQRPVSVLGFFLAYSMGRNSVMAALIFALANILLPILSGTGMPLPLVELPELIASFILASLIMEAMGFAICTIEVVGPYSRPTTWVIGKFIFTFGGLFFPVAFFPVWIQKIVWLTPFPSVLYIPGSFMLTAGPGEGLWIQGFWLAVSVIIAWLVQRRMFAYVLERGD